MSTVTLKVCDHCDARQNIEYPPNSEVDVQEVKIEVTYPNSTSTSAGLKIHADLCVKCRAELTSNIRTNAQQIPRAA
jgi:hypothetical protein